MRKDIFEDCLNTVQKLSGKNISFWDELAEKHGYPCKEAIRSDFRREAKKKGLRLSDSTERNGGPKILIFDLETSPILRWAWSLWEEHPSPKTIVRDWHILSYSAKWLFDDSIISDVLTPKEVDNADDFRLTESLWNLLDAADIAVAYNGSGFDFKRLNTRFLKNSFLPPSYYLTVDPIVTAKKVFDFSSNSMDFVAKFLEQDGKIHTDFELWMRCMDGEEKALAELEIYNNFDVRILESLYLNILPYISGHPNVSLFYQDDVSRCKKCGSAQLVELQGKAYVTTTNLYRQYRCTKCGSILRGREGLLGKEKRKNIRQ